MSRVADALRLAQPDRPGADAFTTQDHPWSPDLDLQGVSDLTWSSEDDLSTRERDLDEHAPIAAGRLGTEVQPEPEAVAATSPLTDLAPGIRQQIAGVVERVFLPTAGDVPRMVAFAGVDAAAHSGWTAASVADMLAQRTPANVAVVDMNFSNARLHECFGLEGMPGLVDALAWETPLVKVARQVRANLWVIPAGAPAGVTELTAAARARISRLATAYDHVIVNLEPLATWCGGGLPTMADGIVLVIAADATRRQAGRQVAERLQASGAAILGAVLTNRRYAIPEAIYKRL